VVQIDLNHSNRQTTIVISDTPPQDSPTTSPTSPTTRPITQVWVVTAYYLEHVIGTFSDLDSAKQYCERDYQAVREEEVEEGIHIRRPEHVVWEDQPGKSKSLSSKGPNYWIKSYNLQGPATVDPAGSDNC